MKNKPEIWNRILRCLDNKRVRSPNLLRRYNKTTQRKSDSVSPEQSNPKIPSNVSFLCHKPQTIEQSQLEIKWQMPF